MNITLTLCCIFAVLYGSLAFNSYNKRDWPFLIRWGGWFVVFCWWTVGNTQ